MSFRRSLLVGLVALVAACRGPSSFQAIPLPPQDVELSRPGLARIYVLRGDQLRGKLRPVRVEDGDELVGALGQDDFLCWERAPGRTLLAFTHEARPVDGGEQQGYHSLDAVAGRTYYLLVSLERPGLDTEHVQAGHPEVRELEASAGREKLRSRSPAPVR